MKKKTQRLILILYLGVVIGTSAYAITLFIQIQEFGQEDVVTELPPHEDEVVKLENWKIINTVQPGEIVPLYRLMMIVDAETKWEYDSKLLTKIEILQSNEIINSFDSNYSFEPNESRRIQIPFFLDDPGFQDVKIQLVFKNETSDFVFENRVRHVRDLQVLSVADTIQLNQSRSLYAGVIVSGAIGIVTALALIFTVYYSRKEVTHLEETAKIETRPWLGATTMISYDSDKKMLIFHYKNYGKLPARNVMEIYGKNSNLMTKQIVKESREQAPHTSIVFPDQETDFTISRLTEDTMNRIENGSGPLYLWIRIDFTYEENKRGQYGVIFEYIFRTRIFNVKEEWTD